VDEDFRLFHKVVFLLSGKTPLGKKFPVSKEMKPTTETSYLTFSAKANIARISIIMSIHGSEMRRNMKISGTAILWNCFDEWHWSFNECFRGAKYAK
jgi:hypothetical protein